MATTQGIPGSGKQLGVSGALTCKLQVHTRSPVVALAPKPHQKGCTQELPEHVPAQSERASKPVLCGAAFPSSQAGCVLADSAKPQGLPETRGELTRRLQTRVFRRGDLIFRADLPKEKRSRSNFARWPRERGGAGCARVAGSGVPERGLAVASGAGPGGGGVPAREPSPQDGGNREHRPTDEGPRAGSRVLCHLGEPSTHSRQSEGMRVPGGTGGTARTPRAGRPPSRGWQRLPVAVLGFLSVAPRVSQRQEQQQRTQAPAQLPPRHSSPTRRRRHHQGSSRSLPGGAGALSPPAPGSSAAAAFPLPGRGRRRTGASAPPARGTGLGASRGLGSGQEPGAGCKFRGGVVCGARPARGSRGLSRLARGRSLGIHRLTGLDFGLRPRRSPLPGLGGKGRARRGGGCVHLAPGSLDREEEEEEEEELARTPRRGRGSPRVNQPPSWRQVTSEGQGRLAAAFPPPAPTPCFPATPGFTPQDWGRGWSGEGVRKLRRLSAPETAQFTGRSSLSSLEP